MLNPKQVAFVNAYILGSNASLAARSAGYSAASAHVTGSRLLKQANVAEAIRHRQQKVADVVNVSIDWIAEKLVEEATNAAKPGDRIRALELLAKWQRMFVEQTESHVTHDISPLAEFTIAELRALRASLPVEVEARGLD